MEVSKSITKIRKAKGFSQAQIAEKLQTTQQQYSKYEVGLQEIPVRHIITLCELYNVTANKLMGIDTFMTKEEEKTKFERLYQKTIEIIDWAEYQEHIPEDGATVLLQNIRTAKEDIENE